MSKNEKSLVLEGVCVPSHTVHIKNEMVSWGALRRVWAAGQGRFSSPSTLP